MSIVYKIIEMFGMGLQYLAKSIHWIGEWLEDFAAGKLNAKVR
jgi:hypothetical protein